MRSFRSYRNNVLRAFGNVWDFSRPRNICGIPSIPKKEENFNSDPYEGNFSFTECDQYTKVTLIGAAGRVGRTLSLLLKTCPLVDHLCLFDIDKSVKGIGVDVSHIDTKCCVSYFCGMKNIQKALDAPDVVVIAAGCPSSPQLNGKKLFDKNAPIVAGLSEACARFCPKACVVLITNPINSLVPVVGEVYQMITNRMPSRKLFGLTTLDVVRANTFVAEVVRKDPNNVIVPVVGGTSQETIVPVISQMKPCCRIKRGEIMALTECIKRAEGNLADCQNCGTRGASSLSTAYAAFRFTSSLVMALKGAQDIIECAYVKSNIIPELEYLASPLKLGICGIEHNFGYPHLSDYEVDLMEQAAPALKSDIEMEDELGEMETAAASLARDIDLGKDFARCIEETVQRGVVWKRLMNGSKANGETIGDREEVERKLRKRKMNMEAKESPPPSPPPTLPPPSPPANRDPDFLAPVLVGVPQYAICADGVRGWFSRRNVPFGRWLFGRSSQPSRDDGEEISSDLAESDAGRGEDSQNVTNEAELNKAVSLNDDDDDDDDDDGGVDDKKKTESWEEGEEEQKKMQAFGPKEKFLSRESKAKNPCRMYHSGRKDSLPFIKRKRPEVMVKNLAEEDGTEPEKSKMNPMKALNFFNDPIQYEKGKKSPWDLKFERAHYKLLNASAKRKYRSFNVRRKISPGPSMLFLSERGRKYNQTKKNAALTPRKDVENFKQVIPAYVAQEDGINSGTDIVEAVEEDKTKLIVSKKETDELTRYKDFILGQLRELKRENEQLKRRLVEIVENKKMEAALQVETDNLEMEKTRMKACWLVMSSTLDAVSNFCRKFTSKPETRLPMTKAKGDDEEVDDFDGTLGISHETGKKNEGCDEKYYNFLNKLMQDQVEEEKARNRLGK